MSRVLLVEDDPDIASAVAMAIEADGHEVVAAGSGRDALERAGRGDLDLVLLDLGLPDVDGLDVCRRLRAGGSTVPILVLTGRADEIDTVLGLDAGADDYVAKPFRLAELLARIRALVRRAEQGRGAAGDGRNADVLRGGDVTVDVGARLVWRAGEPVALTPKEFDLLALLVSEAGRVITRERIIDEVWDPHWFGPTKTLDMHVLSLRRKLGDHPSPRAITTVRGVGYRFERDG